MTMALELTGCVPLLQVFDMPRSLAFYRDVLGFDVVSQSHPGDHFDWGWLRRGDIELMLNTAYEAADRPPKPDDARVAAHADVGLYIGAPDVDAVHTHLRARGVDVAPPKVAPYGMKQLYVRDPDGYTICFQARSA